MAQTNRPQAEILSGSPQPNFTGYATSPVVSRRNPTVNDRGYPFGQIWVNKLTNICFCLTSVTAGTASWVSLGSSVGGDITSVTGDAGAAITPVLGNVNLLGSPDIRFSGAGNTLSATDLVKITPYVVAASDAPYTSIQAAINAAAAAGGGTVALRAGTYVEDITLANNVNLVGFSGFSLSPFTIINGTVTASFAGSVTLTNIGIIENVGSPIVISGAAATSLVLVNCVVVSTASDIISCTNTNCFAVFYFSILTQLGAFKIFNVTAGNLNFAFCFMFGNSVVNNTISGGQASSTQSGISGGITITGTGRFSCRGGQIDGITGFAIDQQAGGNSADISNADISTGAALSPVINIAAGCEASLSNCRIGTTFATAVSGTGVLNLDIIRFFQSSGTLLNPALTVRLLDTVPLPISGISPAMVAGSTTILTTAVKATSRIFLTVNAQDVANPGILSAPTASIVPGVSFVINSTNGGDTSSVNWWVVN